MVQGLAGSKTSSQHFLSLSSLTVPSTQSRFLSTADQRPKSTLICVSGITGKSKPRWLVGTTDEGRKLPREFSSEIFNSSDWTCFNRNRTFLWNGRLLTGKPRRQGQANLNLQAAFGAIACPDRASVKTHGTFGDGKAQTYSAGFTSAGIVDAIERTKEFVQSFLGDTGAGVHDSNDGFGVGLIQAAFQSNFCAGAFLMYRAALRTTFSIALASERSAPVIVQSSLMTLSRGNCGPELQNRHLPRCLRSSPREGSGAFAGSLPLSSARRQESADDSLDVLLRGRCGGARCEASAPERWWAKAAATLEQCHEGT